MGNDDLKKGRLIAGHRLLRFYIVGLMKKGLNVSRYRRCCRMMLCVFIFVLCSLLIFFVPLAIVLCIFVNAEYIAGVGFIQMIVFKAGYGGLVAMFLSPITTFLML